MPPPVDSRDYSTFRSVGRTVPTPASGMLLQKVPTARLVILPAAPHIGISGETAVLVPMVSAFLDDVPPATPDLF